MDSNLTSFRLRLPFSSKGVAVAAKPYLRYVVEVEVVCGHHGPALHRIDYDDGCIPTEVVVEEMLV